MEFEKETKLAQRDIEVEMVIMLNLKMGERFLFKLQRKKAPSRQLLEDGIEEVC